MPEQTAGHPLSEETRPAPWSLILPATPDKTGQARRFLAAILNGCALADDAITCLGELANNAVTHSDSRLPGGTFTVRVEAQAGRLRVEVRDNGGPWACRHPSGDGGPASGGRGLLIVSRLAHRWGVTPTTTAAQRTVWFELDLP